jgi:hypothetical protein
MYDGLLYSVYSGNKRYYTKLYKSSTFRDPLNRSTCKIEKTRTDPTGYKLTEPKSGFFLLQKIRRGNSSMAVTALNKKQTNVLFFKQGILKYALYFRHFEYRGNAI